MMPDNPLVGGVALRRPAIQSPNFVTHVSGWSINADGTAEFQNITARGSIMASQITNTPIGSSTFTGGDINSSTIETTTITFDATGGLLLIYATTSTTTTFTTAGSNNWTAPAGVTSVDVQITGAAGGAASNQVGASTPGSGGGGGEFARNTAVAVTPANVYHPVVGAGGGGGGSNQDGNDGGNSSFAGDATTVTAHGGKGGFRLTPGGAGGTGSTDPIHFNGGGGASGISGNGGGGGGSSAGTSTNGNAGAASSGNSGGAGGAAPSGGGAGGSGGNSGAAGSNGSSPGGGGGGGGDTGASAHAGGSGANGQVSLTYQTGRSLIGVIAPKSGTDSFSNGYPQGIAGVGGGGYVAIANVSAYSAAALVYGAVGSVADTNLYRASAGILRTDSELDLFAGKGPFVSGETWHTISNASGFTGTMRVMKLPWNASFLDVVINLTGSTGGTFTFGSLPDSTYYPTSAHHLTLAVDQSQSSLSGGTARVNVPTSGALTVSAPSFGVSGTNFGGSFIYPTN